MHLLITGTPRCGKTTLVKHLLPLCPTARGFYTEEIKERGIRVGFQLCLLSGEKIIFAHRDFYSPHKVGKYKIDVAAFEQGVLKELRPALSEDKLVIIDEIGKMELLSPRFISLCEELFDKRRILATIPIKYNHPLLKKICQRSDAYVLKLDKNNVEYVKKESMYWLKSLERKEIRFIEEKARDIGLNERILIENAGSNLASRVKSLGLGNKGIIIAGGGNNGADVLNCARKLCADNYEVKIFIAADKSLGPEAEFQKDVLHQLGINIFFITEENMQVLEHLLPKVDFILEGLLGIGVHGQVRGIYREVIQRINAFSSKIIACDIPSGLDPDTGEVLGVAVKAAYTITFIAPKKGFFLKQGRTQRGMLFVENIGVSKEMLEKGIYKPGGE